MTGASLARQLLAHRRMTGISVDRGDLNRYDVRERRIYLSPEVFDGRDTTALAISTHEVAHALQRAKMGAGWLILFSRIEPINYLVERAAWNRARQLFRDALCPSELLRWRFDRTAASCLRVDALRALAHVVGAVAVLVVAFALR